MVDHLTGLPIATPIPDKEATTVVRAILNDLFMVYGCPQILLSDNGKEFSNDLLAYVCNEFDIKQHFTIPYTPMSNVKTENFNKFLKASLRKLCQEDKASWDQVLPHVLFAYMCCPYTSTGESPFTLVNNRDPELCIQKLIKVVTPYQGKHSLGKSIEQSRITLSIAAKMLERMRKNQKRVYEGRKMIHQFRVGDLVLLRNHAPEKMDLKCEPNYRIIKLSSVWSAIVKNISSGRTRRCNVGDP